MSGEHAPAAATAALLVEALPYIRRFAGAVIVVKYGGSTHGVADDGSDSGLSSFAEDIALLRSVGLHPVVVNGGGPPVPYEQDHVTGDFWPAGQASGWSDGDRPAGAACARG